MIDEREQVQAFDIDVSQNVEHVVIYTNNNPDEPPFEAVPFYARDHFEDGTTWYDEPLDFAVTDEYRRAVAEHADIDVSDVKLERDALDVEEVTPV